VTVIASSGPNDNDHTAREMAYCDDAFLAVVGAIIKHVQRLAFEHDGRILKCQAAFVERGITFGVIKGNSPRQLLYPRKF